MCKARYAHCLLTVCLVFSEQDGPAGGTGISKDACMQNRAYVRRTVAVLPIRRKQEVRNAI